MYQALLCELVRFLLEIVLEMAFISILKNDVHVVLVLYSVANIVNHDCFTAVCGR